MHTCIHSPKDTTIWCEPGGFLDDTVSCFSTSTREKETLLSPIGKLVGLAGDIEEWEFHIHTLYNAASNIAVEVRCPD